MNVLYPHVRAYDVLQSQVIEGVKFNACWGVSGRVNVNYVYWSNIPGKFVMSSYRGGLIKL